MISGLGAVVISESENEDKNVLTETWAISVSEPAIKEEDGYVIVNLEEQTSMLSDMGKPMMPVITKTFTFPVGTRIVDVGVDFDVMDYSLSKKIQPSPRLIPLSLEPMPGTSIEVIPDESVYSSTDLYPSEPYTVKKGVGLCNNQRVVYFTVHCYVQYVPAENLLKIPKFIDISIDYQPPAEPLFGESAFDLLIITSENFVDELQPLVDHKNSIGINTKMEAVEDIYPQYDGVADWEDIKLRIKDAIESWNIKYVLLAGGHKGQTNEWWVPDFRSHNWNPGDTYEPPYDETYSSDLYYADVYKYDNKGIPYFDDWDSNNNGVYAEGPSLVPTNYDTPDFYPDVHVGRLPIRYSWEASIAVDKIIDYENNADDSWFKKGVMVGGDGFPAERYPGQATPGVYEGEITGDAFANYLETKDFEITKCYCSGEGDVLVEDSDDVYDVISEGCGFVHMTGHANAMLLGSYAPDVLPLIPFYSGFNVRKFDNTGKLPFMICEGCHNAQFDVTTQDLVEYISGVSNYPLHRWEWIPHDSSSWFVLQEGGGAIGIIGNTALGLGGLDYGCTEFVGGWLMLRFAHAFAIQGKQYTGTVWSQGITDYINNFPVDKDMGDRKTIEERVLLGDPSVKLGGYGSSMTSDSGDSDNDDNEKTNENPASVDVPIWEKGDSWTYNLDTIDFNLSEVDGRSIDFELNTGDIKLEVVDVTADSYITSISSDDIDASFGLSFDFYIEDKEPIEIPSMSFQNITLDGQMVLEKETLGIETVEITLAIDLIENLDALPLELPPIVYKLKSFMSIPANIDLTIEFDNPFVLLDFPLDDSNAWGLSEGSVTVTIDGKIESIWLRILNIVNKIIPLIPEEFAQYLPVVDISDVLNDFGIETVYNINISERQELEGSPLFEVKGQETVNVEAGSYDTSKISVLEGNGKLYYSQDARNIVKISIPISDYIPIIEDINLELKE